MEEWRNVPGFVGMYLISNLGRVRSVTRRIAQDGPHGPIVRTFKGKVLSQQFDKRSGYWQINLYEAGHKTLCFKIHTLVCRAFVGSQPTDEHEVNHKNGIKTDNHAGNLEWMTHPQNVRHGFVTGLNPGNGQFISDEDVALIREAWNAGGQTQQEIANNFGCSQTTVSQIVNFKERTAEIKLPENYS